MDEELQKALRAFERAKAAAATGDPRAKAAAQNIARGIKQLQARGPQQAPQESQEPGWLEAAGGMAGALPGAALEAIQGIPAAAMAAYENPRGTIEGAFQGMAEPIAGGLMHMGVPPLSDSDRELYEERFLPKWGSSRAIKERMKNDPLGILGDVSMVAAPISGGLSVASKAAGAGRAGSLLSAASRAANPVTLPSMAARSSYKGARTLLDMLGDPARLDPAAKALGTTRGAAKRLAEGFPDIAAARAELREMGPEAMAWQGSLRGEGLAEGAVSAPEVPAELKNVLIERALKQKGRVKERLAEDFPRAMGVNPRKVEDDFVAQSKLKDYLDTLKPAYAEALQSPIDATPVVARLKEMFEAAGSNKPLQNKINKLSQYFYDTSKKDAEGGVPLITTGKEMQVARHAAGEMIEDLVPQGTIIPSNKRAIDIGKVHKTQGVPLAEFMEFVVDELQRQIPDVGALDLMYREAKDIYKKGNVGRFNVVGGDKSPKAIAKEVLDLEQPPYADYSPSYKERGLKAMQRGLASTLGETLAGNIKQGLQRGGPSGTAAMDELTAGNTKERIAAVASPEAADRIERIAKREDRRNRSLTDIISAYEGAERGRGKSSIDPVSPKPARPLNRSDVYFAGGLAYHPLLAATLAPALLAGRKVMETGRKARDKITGSSLDAEGQAGIAKAIGRQGPEAEALYDILSRVGSRKPRKMPSAKHDKGLLAMLAAMGLLPQEE